jgi:hypothetical protein
VDNLNHSGEHFGWLNGKDYTHLLESEMMTDIEFKDFIIGLKIIDNMDWSKDAV